MRAVDRSLTLTETLESIPTLFGRLIRLGALSRWTEPSNGENYRNEPDFNSLVRQEHQRLLLEWLGKPLSFKVADMAACFRRAGEPGSLRLGMLLKGCGYDDVLPVNAGDATRLHFLGDMQLLALLVAERLEYFAPPAAGARDASAQSRLHL